MTSPSKFVRFTGEKDPNKVFQIVGGRLIPVLNQNDLMERTGTKSVAEAWRVANVDIQTTFSGSPYSDLSIPTQWLVKPTATKKEEEEKGEGDKDAPDWLKDDEYFNQLSPDEQAYIISYHNVLKENDKEKQEILAQALDDATAQADPYFAEKIRMAQDELKRALGEGAGDFTSKKRDLETRISQIGEDLATGKERLGIDQQAELARQKRTYEYQLENLIEGASHKGLTFSTKRALAESRLKTEQTDITESTKREFQRKIGDLQKAASRGDTEAQNLLKDYERMYGEDVTALIRGTEATVGTEGLPTLPDLPGLGPMGGITGSLAEDKQMDILQRAEALANLRNPFL